MGQEKSTSFFFENAPRGKEESVATHLHLCPEISVHDRISSAGKHLFFILGFENTSIEAICRAAGVSEAQFIEHFDQKEALLSAIFEEAWSSLLSPQTAAGASPKEQLQTLARRIIAIFREDRELRDLMLLEGRRVRGGEMMIFTPSFTDVTAWMDSLLQMALGETGESPRVHLLRSSISGGLEGMLRDLALQERLGYPVNYSAEKAEQFAGEMIDLLLSRATPAAV
jgi:AcrR family transcriptional regulator